MAVRRRYLTTSRSNCFATSFNPPSHWSSPESHEGIVAGETTVAEADLLHRSTHSLNVRYGSKADIHPSSADVRFTPESGHCGLRSTCPLHAKRWGNRPALLWIAEDFGCCASG